MTSRQLAVLLGVGGAWGASFLFIKVLIDGGVDPIGVSAGRTLLGAIALLPFAFAARKQFPRDLKVWCGLAVLGFANFALPWTLFGVAEQHAPSGAASVANATMPMWAAIFSLFLLKTDRLTLPRAVGLALGFAGVLVLMGGDLFEVGSDGFVAIFVLLGATLCYGISTVSIRRWLREVPAVFLAIGQIGFAAAYLVPLSLALGQFPGPSMGGHAVLSLLLLGAINSGVAVIGYMWLISSVGAVRASVVTYILPPIGVTLGWLVLDEPIGWNLVLSLACVIAGVALVQQLSVRALWNRGPFGTSRVVAAAAAD